MASNDCTVFRIMRASEASSCDSMMEAGRPSGRARAKQCTATHGVCFVALVRSQPNRSHPDARAGRLRAPCSERQVGGRKLYAHAGEGLMTRRGRAVGSVRTERTGHEPHGLLLASVTQRDKRARFCSQFSLRPIATRPYGNYAWKLRRLRMTSTRASAECLA